MNLPCEPSALMVGCFLPEYPAELMQGRWLSPPFEEQIQVRIPYRILVILTWPILAAGTLYCHHTVGVDTSAVRRDSVGGRDIISAITLIDGREIHFDKGTRPLVRADTLQGQLRNASVKIPIDSVQRVWVRKIDPVRTTLATLGVLVGVAGIASAIAIASKQSCPFIYSWDGSQYVFDAEPYGGAITRGLERDDYGELRSLVADHGVYRLLVTNEVNETQYTNRLRLMLIDHAPGEIIKVDEFGRFYAFDSLVPPSSAHDDNGLNLLPWLVASDQRVWEPLPSQENAHGAREEITLTFPKPPAARYAFLVARVSTGLWGSQMIRQFSQLRGTALSEWYATIDSSETQAAALRKWNLREELYALKVSIEEPSGWEVRGILPGGGPFLASDRVLRLDLAHVSGDSVRIRIHPPYGFWALNSFAIAYRTAEDVRATVVEATTARASDGRDVLPALTASDDSYYAMPSNGDYGFVTFRAPRLRPGATRSVFVHARGYYRLHLKPDTPPDSTTLANFLTIPDAAANFAAARYAEMHPRVSLAH
jgi:hypothetical protein